MDRIIIKKKWTTKRIITLSGIALVLISALYILLSNRHVSKLNVNTNTINLDTVKYTDFEEFIPIDGTVQPLKTVLIDAAEGGTVAERLMEEGSMVNKGDPIVKLSNSDLQLEFMNKEALLLDQMNNMRNTRISMEQNLLNLRQQLLEIDHSYIEQKKIYERNKHLYKEKVVSQADFEKIEDDYSFFVKKRKLLQETVHQDSAFKEYQIQQLESSTNLIRQNLDMVKQSLDNLTIKAPVAGQLTALTAEIGDNKNKGQNIGQIDVQAGFKIQANVDEHYISRISKGLKASFNFDDKTYGVVISKVLPQVTNGQFKIEMAFENTVPQGIKQGQTLQIKLNLSKKNKSLVVKNGSFYTKTGGNWIYVVESRKAVKRKIVLGRQNPDYFEVSEGLKAGDIVITSSYETFGTVDELVLQN